MNVETHNTDEFPMSLSESTSIGIITPQQPIGTGRNLISKVHGLAESLSANLSTSTYNVTSLSFIKNAIDKKLMESTYKMIENVVNLCLKPGLELKNSPPYILDNLPDIYNRLRQIIIRYAENYDALSDIEYLRIFVSTLYEKCKATTKLFKEAKEKIFDKKSTYRHRLTKLSLVFSHLLKDLEALFPQNTYSLEIFRITKPDASEWWHSNFRGMAIVRWEAFENALYQSFGVEDRNQLRALQNTIDLTCNENVSIFEFDVFVRLFQPWKNIIETWKALAVLHPGYMAFMTYDEVKAVLCRYRHNPGTGSYVFRASCTKLGQWAIGYVTDDLQILQTIIQNKSLARALLDGERERFYLYPNGCQGDSSILYQLVHNLPEVHLKVTQEQYHIYCRMGSTFELCKICAENDKDIRLEPCCHLLCRNCLINCQCSPSGQLCPFCRHEIKSFESIIIDPYNPTKTVPTSIPLSSTMETGKTESVPLTENNHFSPANFETNCDIIELNVDSAFSVPTHSSTAADNSLVPSGGRRAVFDHPAYSHSRAVTPLPAALTETVSVSSPSVTCSTSVLACPTSHVSSGHERFPQPSFSATTTSCQSVVRDQANLNYAELDFPEADSKPEVKHRRQLSNPTHTSNVTCATSLALPQGVFRTPLGSPKTEAGPSVEVVVASDSSCEEPHTPTQGKSDLPVASGNEQSDITTTPQPLGGSLQLSGAHCTAELTQKVELLKSLCEIDDSSAHRLLQITGYQVQMCEKLWRYFMPRIGM